MLAGATTKEDSGTALHARMTISLMRHGTEMTTSNQRPARHSGLIPIAMIQKTGFGNSDFFY